MQKLLIKTLKGIWTIYVRMYVHMYASDPCSKNVHILKLTIIVLHVYTTVSFLSKSAVITVI